MLTLCSLPDLPVPAKLRLVHFSLKVLLLRIDFLSPGFYISFIYQLNLMLRISLLQIVNHFSIGRYACTIVHVSKSGQCSANVNKIEPIAKKLRLKRRAVQFDVIQSNLKYYSVVVQNNETAVEEQTLSSEHSSSSSYTTCMTQVHLQPKIKGLALTSM